MTGETALLAVDVKDTLSFLEESFRNINLPDLDPEDIDDIRVGLSTLLKARFSMRTTRPAERETALREALERIAKYHDHRDIDVERRMSDMIEAMQRIARAALAQPAGVGEEGCRTCEDTGKIEDRVDGVITCPDCGYPTSPRHRSRATPCSRPVHDGEADGEQPFHPTGAVVSGAELKAECVCGHTPCDGLDCGPYLPGRAPRKKPVPKTADELREIRAKAWATRRAHPLPLPAQGRGRV